MEIRYQDPALERLATDPGYTGKFDVGVIKAFRKRVQAIQAARDERDFYAAKSLHYEKLKGDREGQRSMRLNSQWRLILCLETDPKTGKLVVIIAISDYH